MKTRSIIVTALVMCFPATAPVWAQGGENQGSGESGQASSHQTVLLDLAAWRHAEVRTTLEEQRATHNKSAGYDVAWALMLAQERDLDQAAAKLGKASRGNPSDPSAPYFLGEVRSWQKKGNATGAWRQARDRAKAILEEDKKNGWAWYWQGSALIRLGKYSQAEGRLKKALDKGADPAMTEFQLGLALMYQKKWDPARMAFNRCLGMDSGFSHAYYFRGRVWQELGKTEEMLLDMDRFLTLAPDAREANAARSILRAGG